MPRAKSICSSGGCTQIARRRGKCNDHDPGPWAGSIRNLQRPSNWNTLRNLARRRDRNTCRLCGMNASIHVDHIIPVARGGAWELSNLQTLCEVCHDTKTRNESRGAGY